MSNNTNTKLTLKSLSARIAELEARIADLESNKSSRRPKDDKVTFVREVSKINVRYRLTTFLGKAWYALGYHLKDSVATYNYQGGVMSVSPEEAEHFEKSLRDFFSGDEEKGYSARSVEVTDGDIAETIKAQKAKRKAA